MNSQELRDLKLTREVIQRLTEPVDPGGRRITWKHPYLVMLAEWGRFPANEEHEEESRLEFEQVVKDLGEPW